MPKVSVIIPVYCVERYIDRCARSLFAQTLNDIEFIFVDDCSTDCSIEILQSVIQEYQPTNVRIIHHSENKGASQARMTGIIAATGDYIANCDSDDWLEPEYCETLYKTALNYNADMAICGFYYADDTMRREMSWGDTSVYSDTEKTFRHILAERLPINLWTRIVRREIAQNPIIKLPVSFYADDWALVVQWTFLSKKIAYDGTPLYNYYIGEETQSRSCLPEVCIKNCQQKCNNVNMIYNWLADRHSLSRYHEELVSVKFLTKAVLFPVIGDQSCRRLWRKMYRRINMFVITNHYITRREKCLHYQYLFGSLYPIMIKCFHKVFDIVKK